MKKNIFQICALILMLAFLVAIAVFAIIDLQTVFEPKGLLSALNTLFTGVLPLALALIAARAYLHSGQFSVFCMGCGMLTFGLGTMVADWLIHLPDGPNLAVTIHTISVFCSALFHVIGAVFTLIRPRASKRKRIWLRFYTGIGLGMAGLTYAAVGQLTPPFFLQGIGPTSIRQAVLGMAIMLHVFSAGMFLNLSVKSKSAFLYWYSMSLNMIAIGFLAVSLGKVVGGPIAWVGRSAQYVGGLFALTAMLSALRSAATVGAPLEDIIASFFAEAETSYKNLVETATDAIISCDQTGKILLWNAAAANLFGYASQEAIGVSLFGTIIPEKFSALRAKIAQMITLDQASSTEVEQIETTGKDGRRVPVEFSISLQKLPIGWIVTFIFRDITARKRAQEELRDLLRRYETLLAAVPEIIMEVDHNKVYTWANQAGIEFFGEEVLGKEAADFFAGAQETYENVKSIFHGGEQTIYVESWQRRKDGEKRLLAWWCRVLKDGRGNVIGALSSARDITARKRAEEALRASEARYKSLVETQSDVIARSDQHGCLTFVNDAYCQAFGKSRADLLGHVFTPTVFPDDLPVVTAMLQRLQSPPYRIPTETRHVTLLGIRWFSWDNTAVLDESGNILELQGIGRDITERKRAEDALRESEDKFKYVFDHSIIGKSITRPSGEISVNQAFCEMLGYTPEELRQQRWQDITHPNDLELTQRAMDSLLAGEKTSVRFRKRYLHKDGSVVWADVSTSLRRDQDGKPLYFMTAVSDITARKWAEEALHESEERYRNLLEHAPVGIAVHSEGQIVFTNPAGVRLLGGDSEAQIIGKPIIEIIHPDGLKKAQERTQRMIAGEQNLYPAEDVYLKLDGTPINVQVRATRLSYKGKPAVQVIVTDITERKRAEAERERLLAELAQKNKELEQLVYVTSHDLRSPLVNVQGFSKELQHAVQDLTALLQSAEVPEHIRTIAAGIVTADIQVDLHYILTSIAKMDTLLAGLLKLSRLGRAALTITTLNLNTLLANVLNTFEFQIQAARVNVEVAELPFCQGDATQINQVFSNLVDNALKYLDTSRPGVIKIGGSAQEAQVIYCIADNGIGIAPAHQQKIFEIFHRLNPDYTPGEGLGLTIVRKLLERQGGKVWVESEPGQGSKFYVSLPRA